MPPYLAPYSFAGVASALALLCVGCPSSSDSDGDGTSGDGTAATDDAVTTAPDDDDDDATDDDDDDDATGDDDDDATSDDDDDDTGTGGSSGGGSTGADLCPDATNVCVVPVDDWEGPIAVQSAKWPNEDLECGGEYDEDAFGGATDFDSGTHECTCECEHRGTVVCGNPVIQQYDNSLCSGDPLDSQVFFGAGCVDVPNFEVSGFHFRAAATVSSASDDCVATPGETIDEVAFGNQLVGCGGGSVSGFGCDAGEICMPRPIAPYEPNLCIWREGEHECPEGSAFSQRRAAYADSEDDRACGLCACGNPGGTCFGGSLAVFSDSDCDNLVLTAGDGCTPGSGVGLLGSAGEETVEWNQSDDIACNASTDLETGEANPLNPTTVCCLAE